MPERRALEARGRFKSPSPYMSLHMSRTASLISSILSGSSAGTSNPRCSRGDLERCCDLSGLAARPLRLRFGVGIFCRTRAGRPRWLSSSPLHAADPCLPPTPTGTMLSAHGDSHSTHRHVQHSAWLAAENALQDLSATRTWLHCRYEQCWRHILLHTSCFMQRLTHMHATQ